MGTDAKPGDGQKENERSITIVRKKLQIYKKETICLIVSYKCLISFSVENGSGLFSQEHKDDFDGFHLDQSRIHCLCRNVPKALQ